MTDIDHGSGLARPPQGLVTLTHVIYGLWVLYRIARGWLRLVSERGMPG